MTLKLAQDYQLVSINEAHTVQLNQSIAYCALCTRKNDGLIHINIGISFSVPERGQYDKKVKLTAANSGIVVHAYVVSTTFMTLCNTLTGMGAVQTLGPLFHTLALKLKIWTCNLIIRTICTKTVSL